MSHDTPAVRPARGYSKGSVGTASSTAILDAARSLFLERGYDGVNLDEVGRAAGVSRQTVYNQFGSKEAVLRAVVDRHWTAVKAEVAAVFSRISAESQPADMLRGFATSLLRFVSETDQIAFTRLVIAESRRLPWLAQEFYEAGKSPLLVAFSNCLAEMTSMGVLQCPDPTLAAHQFFGLLQEFIIWPQVMAIGPAASAMPPHQVIVDEAVTMFVRRYGRLEPISK